MLCHLQLIVNVNHPVCKVCSELHDNVYPFVLFHMKLWYYDGRHVMLECVRKLKKALFCQI